MPVRKVTSGLTKQSNEQSSKARIARNYGEAGRNHNPRVGGSSPSSGIIVVAAVWQFAVGVVMFCREFGGIGLRSCARYEPPETAGWLTKQSSERR
jgi:hypothetical protein